VASLGARMTDRAAGLDPTRTVLLSWWLALVAIWVVQQAHDGQHERHELPPLLHLFRDAALAVPLAALAVLGASILLAPRLRRMAPGARDGVADFDRLVWTLLAVGLFAALSLPGHELHGALFGVEQSQVGWLVHALLDASIAAIGAFLALFPVAVVVGPPFRRVRSGGASLADAPGSDNGSSHALIARSTR
jgi:hypothetical protein